MNRPDSEIVTMYGKDSILALAHSLIQQSLVLSTQEDLMSDTTGEDARSIMRDTVGEIENICWMLHKKLDQRP